MSLSHMPDVVMKRILEKSDIRSVFTLRKVSHDLRNFIDDVVPDAGIQVMEISVGDRFIWTRLTFCKRDYILVYEEGKVHVRLGQREIVKKLDEKDYGKVFSEDLSQILRFQKSKIRYLAVESKDSSPEAFEKLLNSIEEILNHRQRLLKAQNVLIQVGKPENVLKILPFLEPGTLETIGFSNSRQNRKLEISRIPELEQWKKAKFFYAPDHILESRISSFLSFSKGEINLEEITVADVVAMKEAFQRSPTFQNFHVKFQKFPEKSTISDSLGQPTTEDHDGDKWWKFEYPNSDDLFTVFLGSDSLLFRHLY